MHETAGTQSTLNTPVNLLVYLAEGCLEPWDYRSISCARVMIEGHGSASLPSLPREDLQNVPIVLAKSEKAIWHMISSTAVGEHDACCLLPTKLSIICVGCLV